MVVFTVTFRKNFFWGRYRFRVIDYKGNETRDERYRTRQQCLDEVDDIRTRLKASNLDAELNQVSYDTAECVL